MSAPPSPSGEPRLAAPGRGLPLALIGVVAATLVLRLVVGSQMHLAEDEAYYRLWSLSPALGYYDHPPMIAWWIWLGRSLAGEGPLGARLLPILSCAATSALVWDLARLAGANRRTAARAGIWYNAMLLVAAGGLLAVPDAPASLFWTLSLWCALRAVRGASAAWWCAAGAAAGLTALSKYSALFLGPGVLLWLGCTAGGRQSLRTVGPWLAAAAAVAIFAINVAWNAEHHWVTFAKQFGRIAPGALAPRYLAEFLLTQALLLNPLIAVFAGKALAGWRREGSDRPALAPFWATSAPFIAYLAIHSLHDRVQAHWTAPVYPALAICAAVAAEGVSASAAWRRLRTAAPILGFGVCAVLALWVALPPGVLPRGTDPALPLRGWPPFAARLEAMRNQNGAAWIATTSYGLNAELSGERAILAPVFQLSERQRYLGLIPRIPPDLGRTGLVVDLPRRMNLTALGRCFIEVRPLGIVARGGAGEAGQAYAGAWVSGPRRDVLRQGCW